MKNPKVFVMIPSYNEEKSIGKVIKEIKLASKDYKILVINDGSRDNTVKEAKKAGAHYIIENKKNLGLAPSFKKGLDECLKLGADIIVNTDADFQYNQKEIPKIVKPIIDERADVVLTDRRVLRLRHMPFGKKYGNTLSTFVTRIVSGYPVRDAQSGFRGFSREAALRLNVLSDYTYVQETIMQAVDKRLKIIQIPCEFRKRAGKSRLISNVFNYAKRAGLTIVKNYVHYKPLRALLTLSSLPLTLGFLLGLRFLYFFSQGDNGHVQSLILSAILLIIGFQIVVLAFIANSVGANRKIIEEILYLKKKKEFSKNE
ncbi:glycosyl transferase family 2 [archaeon]|nr:glycosyl transferase family 2 [archaeon]